MCGGRAGKMLGSSGRTVNGSEDDTTLPGGNTQEVGVWTYCVQVWGHCFFLENINLILCTPMVRTVVLSLFYFASPEKVMCKGTFENYHIGGKMWASALAWGRTQAAWLGFLLLHT